MALAAAVHPQRGQSIRAADVAFFKFNIIQTFQKIFKNPTRLKYGHNTKQRRYTIMSNKELEMKAREHDLSDANVETVAEATAEVTEAAEEVVTGYKKIEKGVVDGYKKIENGVVTGYKKIEDGVVNGYLKIQDGVVEGFGKVIDKCVEVMFAKDGESVEDAKARLSGKEKE
jgi:hypothetical protein